MAMLCRYSFGLNQEALSIENAVTEVLDEGWRTGDIAAPGQSVIGTREMGDRITAKIR